MAYYARTKSILVIHIKNEIVEDFFTLLYKSVTSTFLFLLENSEFLTNFQIISIKF